jgi:hypothetical protein
MQEVMTKEANPVQWAAIEMSLAFAFLDRGDGDATDNIETTLKHLLASLDIFTRDR